jgi:hypothetical protein
MAEYKITLNLPFYDAESPSGLVMERNQLINLVALLLESREGTFTVRPLDAARVEGSRLVCESFFEGGVPVTRVTVERKLQEGKS